jgi:ribosome-associated toxin RatA of RatAB toxin-antitoxin module
MATVRKSVIVPHACAAMFDLVDDFQRYPEFMPWCRAAEVLERTAHSELARLSIDYRGLRTQLVTRNEKQRPRRLSMELVEGPFTELSGAWTFDDLGDEGCKVELQLDYTLGGALQGVLAPVFAHIAETMVESFVQRAEQVGAG